MNLPGYLERATIRDAQVIFVDEITGADWLVPSGNIELERTDTGLRIFSVLPYTQEEVRSELRVLGDYTAAAEDLSLSLQFVDVKPALFAIFLPDVPYLSGFDMEVDGSLGLTLDLSDTVGQIDSADIKVRQGEGVLSLPGPISRSYPIASLDFEAQLSNGLDRLTVPKMNLRLAGPDDSGAQISVQIETENLIANPELNVVINIDELTLNELTQYWPQDIKPNTRAWISRNLHNGTVSDVRFDIELAGTSLDTLDVSSFEGSALLAGIDVTYINQMPPVMNTSGTMRLGLSEVVIDIDGGNVNLPVFEEQLDIESGRVRLHGLDTTSHLADIDLRIDGQLHDAVALIDEEPLRYSSALGIQPASVSGEAQVLLGFDFPLIQDLSLNEIDISAQATLTSTTIENAAFGLALETGQFSLSLDNDGMNIAGTAALGGIRTGLTWRENFNDDTPFRRRYALEAVIENDQRDLIGLNLALFKPPYVDGPIRAEAIYTVGLDGVSDLALEADLAETVLAVPQLNWEKSGGVEAIFAADLALENDRLLSIDNFSLLSEPADLSVSGQARFSDAVQLDSLTLDNSTIGKSQLTVSAMRDSDGILAINVESQVLDGSTFWTALRQSDQTRSFQENEIIDERIPFRFEGSIDQLFLSSQGYVENVTAVVEQEVSGLSSIEFSGFVGNEDTFTVSLNPDGDDRLFSAESENGGAVLNALGFGNDFVDGSLSVNGSLLSTGAVNGTFNIESFRIVDAPLLARLLSVASLTGIVDELQGTGISFSELNLPFSYSQNVFAIRDGAMYGSSLGLTAQGEYDLNRNTLEGEGTLIPAYAVNAAFASIPMLGPILTGGEQSGGVFAATYTMRGSPEDGEITVNPLATLTPGFLRQIFKVFEPPRASASSPPVAETEQTEIK